MNNCEFKLPDLPPIRQHGQPSQLDGLLFSGNLALMYFGEEIDEK